MTLENISATARALNVSERHLRRLVARGAIPFYKLSERTLRFDVSELRAYMKLLVEGEQERRQGKCASC